MSTHASTKIDQKEYLKKYLSGDTNKKKKLKKHKKKDSVKVKIIDDDAHTTQLDVDEELLLGGEDAPQIVGSYIEENPSGGSTVPKWKSIVIKDEDDEDDVKPRIKVEKDLWGPRSGTNRIKDEFSPRRRKSPTPDLQPQRRNGPEDKAATEQRRRTRSRSRERKINTKKSAVHRKRDSNSPRKKRAEVTPTRRNRRGTPERNTHKNKHLDQAFRRSPGSDQSPPRRRKKYSSGDKSPQRRSGIGGSMRHSPPFRRKDSTDQSPPRRRKSISSDQSPPRRRNSDLSPPRKRASSRSLIKIKHEKLSPDLSPVRKCESDRTLVLSKKLKKVPSNPSHTSWKSASPERQRSRWEPREPSRSLSPPPTHKDKVITKTLDGKRAGLQTAEALQKETLEIRRREEEIYAKMPTELSGRDAEIQVRDAVRRGRRAREAQELNPEEQLRKEAHEQKKKELYDRWGKGLKQIEAYRSKVDSEQYESSKPLARYSNDADLELHLREKERADDPMLEYMRKKNQDRMKQENVPIMPTYKGSFPENRFGIRPGYRWDGVDRSNGYEKKWFDKQNEKLAVQDEAYKYSVEDM